MKQTLLVLTLSCSSVMAHADFMSGNDLLNGLKGNAINRASAIGYIAGAADSGDFKNLNPAKLKTGFCFAVPEEVVAQQLVDIVKSWLEKHAEKRHHNASSLIAAALDEKFPCK